jgi:mRNA interferase MazF
VVASVKFLKAGAFDAQNIVTVPESKLLRKLGQLSENDFDAVVAAVLNWLGYNKPA